MSTELKRRRGTTAEHAGFVGAQGEITVDTTKNTAVVHDGATPGGYPLAKTADLGSMAFEDVVDYYDIPDVDGLLALKVASLDVSTVVALSQAAYDALTPPGPDADTLYLIV